MKHELTCLACAGRGFWKGLAALVRRGWENLRRERLTPVPVDRVRPNPYQPRTWMSPEGLDALRESVRQHGVIIPIIVCPFQGDEYILVAGQRRLRAARDAGLAEIPAIVRKLTARQMMEASLLENQHREALGTVEMARVFERICARYSNLAPSDVAETMGLDPQELEEARRLLALPETLRDGLRTQKITEGHAKVLADVADAAAQKELIELVSSGRLTIEETGEMVDRVLQRPPRYVAAEESIHVHSPRCAFAELIPAERRTGFYSLKEAKKRGKVACMNCL